MRGRGTTWATSLPAGPRVAVRHSRHGGTLAALTRDLFLAPTRAPHELDNALRLAAAGVRTPAVVAYAVYAATGPLRRADVVTDLLDGMDLATVLGTPEADLDAIAAQLNALLHRLGDAGATHPDLNARNVLLVPGSAAVLDVDRVRFSTGRVAASAANAARLTSSLRKLAAARVVPPPAVERIADALDTAGARQR